MTRAATTRSSRTGHEGSKRASRSGRGRGGARGRGSGRGRGSANTKTCRDTSQNAAESQHAEQAIAQRPRSDKRPPLAPRADRLTRSSPHSAEEAADAAQALVGLSGSADTQGGKEYIGGGSNAAELQCRGRTRGVSLVAGAYRALNGTPDRTVRGPNREPKTPVVYHASDEDVDLGLGELEEEEEQEEQEEQEKEEREEEEEEEEEEKEEEEEEEGEEEEEAAQQPKGKGKGKAKVTGKGKGKGRKTSAKKSAKKKAKPPTPQSKESWQFGKREKAAIFMAVKNNVGSAIHNKEFAFKGSKGVDVWHTRVAHHVVALLRADAVYMKEHSHDIDERFGRSEMTHLRVWWQSQRKQETARLNKARGLSTTGAAGGIQLSRLVKLRADAFASNSATSKEEMTEEVVDCNGKTLRLEMEGEGSGCKPSRRQKEGGSSQAGKSAPAGRGRGAPPSGSGGGSSGHSLAQPGESHGTENATTSARQTSRDSAPRDNSVEDLVSSDVDQEDMDVGGLPASFDPSPSVDDRRGARGDGRALSTGVQGAEGDIDDIDSYPSEAESMRDGTFSPLSPGDGGAVENAPTSRRKRQRNFNPNELHQLVKEENAAREKREEEKMGKLAGLVQSIQGNVGGAGASVSPTVEKRKLELLEQKQTADMLQMKRANAKSLYDGARIAHAEGYCTKEKVQELWNAWVSVS